MFGVNLLASLFDRFVFSPSGLFDLLFVVIDICLAWATIYYILRVVKRNNKTMQIFKGILIIIIIKIISDYINLTTLSWITNQIINWGFLAIIVIFQPEIRLLLEKIGQTHLLSILATLSSSEAEKLVDEVVKAAISLSDTNTGALITFERNHFMDEYIATGTKLDSEANADILQTIFMPGTLLHDGAVIIKGTRIACASAYFPPTRMELPTRYGARHRAAVGISEITDCLTVVVSEETGTISLAMDGRLERVSKVDLKERLMLEMGFGVKEHGGDLIE